MFKSDLKSTLNWFKVLNKIESVKPDKRCIDTIAI